MSAPIHNGRLSIGVRISILTVGSDSAVESLIPHHLLYLCLECGSTGFPPCAFCESFLRVATVTPSRWHSVELARYIIRASFSHGGRPLQGTQDLFLGSVFLPVNNLGWFGEILHPFPATRVRYDWIHTSHISRQPLSGHAPSILSTCRPPPESLRESSPRTDTSL